MKKSDPIAMRFDLDVKEAVEADAEAQDRTQTWVVNSILREHYKLPKPTARKAAKAK